MPKQRIDRGQSYRIMETLGDIDLIGHRCRIVLNKPHEDIEIQQGYLYDLQALMLSGKQAKSVIELPPCKLKPVSTRHCTCQAYRFPHAPGLGQCKGPKEEQVAPVGMDLNSLFIGGPK